MNEPKPIHAKPSLYAFYFDVIKEIGFRYGYNIVLHGSMNRDLDLIAIPWQVEVGDKDEMIDRIADTIGGLVMMQERTAEDLTGKRFVPIQHGRMTYIININRDFKMKHYGLVAKIEEYADPQYYIDISVMPTINVTP